VLNVEDYNFKTQENAYTPVGAYAQSKIANIYMANYIDRHFGRQGIHATSVHPGGIMTPLTKYLPADFVETWLKEPENRNYSKSTEQGAATTVWAAVGKEWEGKGGKYLENVQVSPPMREGQAQTEPGHAEYAYDEEKEETLWADSLKMVGLE
jgi:NAD(P)-dependent dehydrogenase (short-subunit alcohol dehydrogenase family)